MTKKLYNTTEIPCPYDLSKVSKKLIAKSQQSSNDIIKSVNEIQLVNDSYKTRSAYDLSKRRIVINRYKRK